MTIEQTTVHITNIPNKSIEIIADTLVDMQIYLNFQFSAAYFEGPKMAILTTSKDDQEEQWHTVALLQKIPNTDQHLIVNIFHDYKIQRDFFPNVILSDILYEKDYNEFLKLQFSII